MRHFEYLDEAETARLFHLPPRPFTADDDPSVLAVALGATLYSPGTRPNLAADIAKQVVGGVTSTVICLEDSVADVDLPHAESNTIAQLRAYSRTGRAGPLIFVRIRDPAHIPMIIDGLGEDAFVVTGFVLPKFTEESGAAYLAEVEAVVARTDRSLYVMPVLESADVIHAESRIDALLRIRALLERYRRHVLAVRVGTTDLSGAYGLRRSRDLSIYDLRVVAGAITDIVNVFGRADGTGFAVTGPVWEYYSGIERIFKPRLRATPFTSQAERNLRTELIAKDLDGLIREVVLDYANGLTGKTVIHPSHVAAVHALLVVSHEEYVDALDILNTNGGGGASASTYGNKMNESKPHSAWARRLMLRAQVFGVGRASTSFVDLLGAGLHR
ncbi:MAG TPA: HpcH/HpaI aldolase/citrate lyase family protein [Jatrophihabitantaceae bacterium]|nr:HpcH/HpaI aldolase/citrate lyase family protein [Jatrophihabitantaceae bacterium]